MKYYYETKDGETVELIESVETRILTLRYASIIKIKIPDNCIEIDLQGNELTSLSTPNNCKKINCLSNKISTLIVSDKCEYLNCSYNELTKLIVPKVCKELYCSRNNLEELILEGDYTTIDCSRNKIKKLEISNKCKELICSYNELYELNVPKECKYLDCSVNRLTELEVPEKIEKLYCYKNKIETILVSQGAVVFADDSTLIRYKKIAPPKFGHIDKTISNLILKIKNPVLWSIADLLTKNIDNLDKNSKISIKDIKKLEKSNPTFAQMLNKAEGRELISKFSNGFSINDIQSLDFVNSESLFQNKFIQIDFSTRDGAQIYYKKQKNYVFQINLKKFKTKEILETSPNNESLEGYMIGSNHPTSNTLLTLSRIRYAYLEDRNAIVLDEIQTDLEAEEFLGKELMQGWEEFTMKLFIQFARKQYKIRKIYMPTYDIRSSTKYYPKKDKDTKVPPMYLYKELPNKFGFKKTSDIEGFMVLEKFELPKFEDYRLI